MNPDRYAISYNNKHDNNENVFNNNNGTVEAVSYSHFPYLNPIKITITMNIVKAFYRQQKHSLIAYQIS
jgi:hypothetical protein